jgi:hypothetical protein
MAHNHRMQNIADPYLNAKRGIGTGPFDQGREAADKSMLPLPSSEATANDFNEGYDYEEYLQGVPLEARNTYPRGQ